MHVRVHAMVAHVSIYICILPFMHRQGKPEHYIPKHSHIYTRTESHMLTILQLMHENFGSYLVLARQGTAYM